MLNLLSIITFLPAAAALIRAVFLHGEDETAQRNQEMSDQITILRAAKSRVLDLGRDISQLRRSVPETSGSESASGLISEFYTLEEKSGATLTDFDLLEPVGENFEEPLEGVLPTRFKMTVTGTADEVSEFVRELQTGERLVALHLIDGSGTASLWSTDLYGALYVSQK